MDPNLFPDPWPQQLLQLIHERNFIVSIILQILDEEKYYYTKRTLEKESGVYFNLEHFNKAILLGDWNEAESYTSAFIKVEDSHFSTKIFFDIRKNKFLEALARDDRSTAVEILNKELKYFQATYPEQFKELTLLIPFKNIRENAHQSYAQIMRVLVSNDLTKAIKNHPLLKDKLKLPRVDINTMQAICNILKLDLQQVIRR